MDERMATLLADLERAETLAGGELHRAARRGAWVAEFSAGQLSEFLAAVSDLPLPLSPGGDRLLANWLVTAVQAADAGEPFAPLFIIAAVISLLALTLIEPATTRAAFRDRAS